MQAFFYLFILHSLFITLLKCAETGKRGIGSRSIEKKSLEKTGKEEKKGSGLNSKDDDKSFEGFDSEVNEKIRKDGDFTDLSKNENKNFRTSNRDSFVDSFSDKLEDSFANLSANLSANKSKSPSEESNKNENKNENNKEDIKNINAQEKDEHQPLYNTNNDDNSTDSSNNPNTDEEYEENLAKCKDNVVILPNGAADGPCYENGAVSTEVPLCSKIGVEILKQGGNAMDAAVASTICVGIINSFSSGIGGGGFMLIRIPGEDGIEKIDMVDFRETAPRNTSVEHYQDKADLTKKGGRAVGVPGEVKGLYAAHKKYGRLPWKDLFTRNIEVARSFEVSDQLYKRLSKLKDCIFADEGLKEVYTRNSELVRPKDVIHRENYARTLEKISDSPEAFYSGDIAGDMIESIKKEDGVMEKDDLERYEAIFRDTLSSDFLGYKLYTTNLPTSGLFIIEAMNILEHFDLKSLKEEGEKIKGKKQFPHYHLLIEIFKFVASKRGKMADPAFLDNWRNILYKIISKRNARIIADKINLNKVLEEKEYEFEGQPYDDHGTTHLNVVDKDEMFVLVTSTVNLEFGAKFMCKKTGVIFNNEIDDFYVPNVKNAFNLAGMPKNIIRPDKRPFSSAAPFLLIKHNEVIALGAAGGTRIPTSLISIVFHLLLNKSLAEAVAELRIHNQFHPPVTYIEHGMDKDIVEYLTAMGHKVEESTTNTVFTSVQGIHLIKTRNGKKIIQAVSDQRKGGASFGY